jgi:diguanylate cyclase (GGDEF)-like protein/PAS domain S-box-containing protein
MMPTRDASPEQLELTLHATLDVISDGVWDWDANTGYVYRSPAWYRMLGYDVDSLDNTVLTWQGLIHPDDRDRVMAHFNAYVTAQSDVYQIEYRCRTRDGGYHWIEDRAKVVQWNEDGSVARLIGAHRDIHEQKVAQLALEQRNRELNALVESRTRELQLANTALQEKIKEIEELAEQDPLTGAFNRHRFDRTLRQELERSCRYGSPLSLIILDIDFFKLVNDRYGHKIGDVVLIAMAQYIQANIRKNDLLTRWGGEEFSIIAPDSPLSAAASMAEKLRSALETRKLADILSVTCSFGVAQFDGSEDMDALIRRADKALYRAKTSGRNRVEQG